MRIFAMAALLAVLSVSAGCTSRVRSDPTAATFTVNCGKSWAVCEDNARQHCGGDIEVIDKQKLTNFSNAPGAPFATYSYIGTFACSGKPVPKTGD